jgi:hypothetical protein
MPHISFFFLIFTNCFNAVIVQDIVNGDTESRKTVTDTYLRNLESTRMRHEVLTNNSENLSNANISPFRAGKSDVIDVENYFAGNNDDDDDDVIILP